ncbi:hypothetical protein Trydic_g1004 [Trypoxylus dichotomus]
MNIFVRVQDPLKAIFPIVLVRKRLKKCTGEATIELGHVRTVDLSLSLEVKSLEYTSSPQTPSCQCMLPCGCPHSYSTRAVCMGGAPASTIYSDLVPSDYHPFGPMKKFLGGKHLSSDDNVKSTCRTWLY